MSGDSLFLVLNSTTNFLSKRQEIAERAQKEGFEVHVVTPRDSGVIEGFEHHRIPLHRRSVNPVREFRTVASLIQLYREQSPDIVHHFTIKPIVYGALAARLAPVGAVINNFTGLGYTWTRTNLKARILRNGLEQVLRIVSSTPNQRFLFQNPDDLSYFVNRGIVTPAQGSVIRSSGIDIDTYVPMDEPDGDPVVILPARMLWAKGVGEFVAAARVIHNRGVDARFVLVGKEDESNPDSVPRSQLEQWDESAAVEWWGYQDDMVATYGDCHIVCLPSYYREGVPQVLLEAAACTRPVVTTDTPGCREAILDGKTGYLVPPRDITALANRLEELIEDKELRQAMGAAGRTLDEEEFSREIVVERTIQLYQELTY